MFNVINVSMTGVIRSVCKSIFSVCMMMGPIFGIHHPEECDLDRKKIKFCECKFFNSF